MVKVVKLSTAAMVHAVLLRTVIIRHVKHTLAIFRANHIKATAFHVLYHHITKYRLLTRRRLCRLSDSLLLTQIFWQSTILLRYHFICGIYFLLCLYIHLL